MSYKKQILKFGVSSVKTLVSMVGLLMLLLVLNTMIQIEDSKSFFLLFRTCLYVSIIGFLFLFVWHKSEKKLTKDHKKRLIRMSLILITLFVFYEVVLQSKGLY